MNTANVSNAAALERGLATREEKQRPAAAARLLTPRFRKTGAVEFAD
jgi:hypothetical protein